MKKFGFLIFAVALVGSILLVWQFTGRPFSSFGFNLRGKRGSGIVKTEKRDLRDFTGVHAGGALELEITAGKEFSVELEADDNILPLIKTEVRNGILYFSVERRMKTRNRIFAKISMPELNNLDLSGASKAEVEDVRGENLTIEIGGASRLEIGGEINYLEADLSGASNLEAEELKTKTVKIGASGASGAEIFVTEDLKAKASGASKITFSGEPKNVEKKTSGASKIEPR